MNGLREWKKDGFKGERMVVLPTESFQEYVEHPQVRRLYLTDVGFFPHARHHYRERKEGIEEYIFIFCMEGSGTIIVKDRKYTLQENQAFCIPCFQGHSYYAHDEDPWSILWVHFKGEDTKYFPLTKCQVLSFNSQDTADRMHFLFVLLFQALDENYTLGNFIYLSQTLSLILAEAYDREQGQSVLEQNKHVTDVVRYMYKHLEENLTLEQIGEEFSLSKSYLNAIFQKHTQHSPMDFFIHLKMKKSCRLLRTTDLPVYEVAQKMGYADPYYFSRIFKKIVGISPRQYRKSDGFYFRT